MKMISSYDLTASDKEYLHDCICIITCQSDNVLVFTIRIGNLLLLCNLLHTAKQFPIFDRLLEFHRLRCLLHLLLKHPDDRRIISV